MKYYVKNTYGIEGTSTHRTPETALKACDKREGEGWIVEDENGNLWEAVEVWDNGDTRRVPGIVRF